MDDDIAEFGPYSYPALGGTTPMGATELTELKPTPSYYHQSNPSTQRNFNHHYPPPCSPSAAGTFENHFQPTFPSSFTPTTQYNHNHYPYDYRSYPHHHSYHDCYASCYQQQQVQHHPVYYPSSQQWSTQQCPQQQGLQPAPKLTATQKVHHWSNQGGYMPPNRDSGVHSMSQSSAPSIMSSIHAASQLSVLSSVPSINEGAAGGETLSEEQHALFQNIPSNFHQGDRENARRALSELLPLIRDNEEEVVLKALEIVQKIAKFDSDHMHVEPLIRDKEVIYGLLHVLKMHRGNKRVTRHALCTLFHMSSSRRRGLDLIVRVVEEKSAKCLDDLIYCLSIHEHSCLKYAFLILHNLMTDREISRMVITHAREARIQIQLVSWLGEKNEKLLAITVDILLLLMDRSSEQKSLFLSLGGSKHLTAILAGAQYENLLVRATKLLKYIANCDPQAVVEANALEVLHQHLDHSSQRLVRDVLTCCRDMSDVPEVRQHNCLPLLHKLLQLLGAQDMSIKQLCVQTLANFSANNQQNKEFLLDKGVISAVFQVLEETEAHLQLMRAPQQQQPPAQYAKSWALLEDIQDNCFTILRSMCTGFGRAAEARLAVVKSLASAAHCGPTPNNVLLQKLLQKRVALLRKALRLLCAALCPSTPSSNSEVGASQNTTGGDPRLELFRPSAGPYITELVRIFHAAMSQLPSSPKVEGVSMHELMGYVMSILQSIASRDVRLLRTIFTTFDSQPLELFDGARLSLPQMALRDSQLAARALELMAELARLQEGARLYAKDSFAVDLLKDWTSKEVEQGAELKLVAQNAQRLLGLIARGGEELRAKEECDDEELSRLVDRIVELQPCVRPTAPPSPPPPHALMTSPDKERQLAQRHPIHYSAALSHENQLDHALRYGASTETQSSVHSSEYPHGYASTSQLYQASSNYPGCHQQAAAAQEVPSVFSTNQGAATAATAYSSSSSSMMPVCQQPEYASFQHYGDHTPIEYPPPTPATSSLLQYPPHPYAMGPGADWSRADGNGVVEEAMEVVTTGESSETINAAALKFADKAILPQFENNVRGVHS